MRNSRIRVIEAGTQEMPEGIGSFASRSMRIGDAALHHASLGLVQEAHLPLQGLVRRGRLRGRPSFP